MRMLRWMTKNRTNSSPYQYLDLAKLGVLESDAESAVQYLRDGRQYRGAEAIARYLMDSKTLWAAAGWLMRAPVLLSISEVVYSIVAANRHRLPGGTPECQLKPKG